MGKGAVLSGFLHLAVLLLAVFGLPWFYNTDEVMEATPVTVVSAAQFAELQSKVPPAQKKQEPPKNEEIPPAPPAPAVAQPEPEPEEPAPPEPPPAVQPAPQPPPEPPQQAEAPPQPPQPPEPAVQPEPPQPEPQVIAPPQPPQQPKPEPVPAQEPQVAEAQPKPVPPKKPQPPKKKEEPKKKEQPKQEQVAADDTSFLKDIEKKLKKNQKKSQPQPQQQAALPPDEQYDGPPVSQSEKDEIAAQVARCWNVPTGMQGVADMFVDIRAVFNPDGSVVSAEFADPAAVTSKGFDYRAFADSARRAVLKCNRFKMPANKPYQAWKIITFTFNPRNMGL